MPFDIAGAHAICICTPCDLQKRRRECIMLRWYTLSCTICRDYLVDSIVAFAWIFGQIRVTCVWVCSLSAALRCSLTGLGPTSNHGLLFMGATVMMWISHHRGGGTNYQSIRLKDSIGNLTTSLELYVCAERNGLTAKLLWWCFLCVCFWYNCVRPIISSRVEAGLLSCFGRPGR